MSSFRDVDPDKLVTMLRKALKKEEPIQEALEKYNLDESVIDETEINFEPLDVSAKTVDGNIILNEKLLDGEWRDIIRYAAHEILHKFQQLTTDITKNQDAAYMNNPQEIEAFKAQIDVMEEMYDPEEIQTYIDGLLDHHNIKGKERLRKIKELKE